MFFNVGPTIGERNAKGTDAMFAWRIPILGLKLALAMTLAHNKI